MSASPARPVASEGTVARVGRLVALYIAQGIPFGFATIFIPLMMAERHDFKYAQGTTLSLAQFPWLLKFVWAPAADSRYWPAFGRRKSWIVPAQILLSLTALAAMGLDFHGPLLPIFAVATLTSLWAAVQDTSVDGLAVDMLKDRERGLGNSAQVGGYKIGMVIGSSGLAVVAAHFGSHSAMAMMSAAIALLLLVPLFYREPPPPAVMTTEGTPDPGALRKLGEVLRAGGWGPTLLFIGSVKIGDTMAWSVSKLYLVHERHFSVDKASYLMGVIGLGASITGSVLAGLLAGKWNRRRTLLAFGLAQAFGIITFGAALYFRAEDHALIGLILVSHLASGLLTPVLYAYMMDITDPRIAATHYTMLATVELVAKGTAGYYAGHLADAFHVPTMLIVVGSVGALPLLLLPWVRPAHHLPETAAAPATIAAAG